MELAAHGDILGALAPGVTHHGRNKARGDALTAVRPEDEDLGDPEPTAVWVGVEDVQREEAHLQTRDKVHVCVRVCLVICGCGNVYVCVCVGVWSCVSECM